MSLLSYVWELKTDCVLKNLLNSIEKQTIEWNDSSFQVLGVFGNLFFGKLRRCFYQSELSCWKSCLGESFDLICGINE
jgi:hypothetical protein